MPMIMDHRGRTALDRVLGIGDLSDRFSLFMDYHDYFKDKVSKNKNKKKVKNFTRNAI